MGFPELCLLKAYNTASPTAQGHLKAFFLERVDTILNGTEELNSYYWHPSMIACRQSFGLHQCRSSVGQQSLVRRCFWLLVPNSLVRCLLFVDLVLRQVHTSGADGVSG